MSCGRPAVTTEMVSMGFHGLDLGMVEAVDDIVVGCTAENEWSYGLDVIDAIIWWGENRSGDG